MLELLVDKIKNENKKLHDSLIQINDNNFVYETVCKILNDLDISEDDIKRMLTIINQTKLIDGLDRETLDFILLILLPNGLKLEKSQKDMLNRILKLYPKQLKTDVLDKISKNEMLLSNLESEELFIYFDELNMIFEQFHYNNKDRLIIIKKLIQRNYHATIENKQEKTPLVSVDATSKLKDTSHQEEVNQPTCEIIEEQKLEPACDIIVTKEAGPVVLNKNIIDLFKKHKLYYAKLDDTLKEKLNNSRLDIQKADLIMTLLKRLHIDFKSFYNKECESFVNLLIYSNLEYIDEIIEVTKKRGINLVQLICHNYRILYSKQFGGYFECFMANIDYLDSLNYDYKANTNVYLYYVNNDNLKASYDLYNNIYKLQLGDVQNISILAILEWHAIIDQLIEISRHAMYSVEQTNMQIFDIYNPTLFYILKSFNYQTRVEYELSELIYFVTAGLDPKAALERIDSKKGEMNSYKVSKTELEHELDNFFLHSTVSPDEELWIIPHTVQIEPKIFENEYVSFLENNYCAKEFVYLISKTRVSRIKVLRVLSHLLNQGVEITKDVVEYALKFNYIFTQNDLENINSVFNQKKKIWK